jgi:hypothetical protein
MFSLEKKWIIIQAYKHNEELHRQWTHSYVLEDNEDYFVLISIRAAVVESDGRKWHTKEPALFILSKKHWFNVIAMLKEKGICYYVNIASPAIFDKGFIKYIDYDLDIKLYEDGTTRLLDVSEYKKHADEQGYSEDIRTILHNSVDNVYNMINKKEFPFVDSEIHRLYKKFEEETIKR